MIGTAEVSLITKSSFAVEEAANIEDLIIKASEVCILCAIYTSNLLFYKLCI